MGQERPPLQPVGLHELRHAYVSTMHAAGFSLERIGDYVGHTWVSLIMMFSVPSSRWSC